MGQVDWTIAISLWLVATAIAIVNSYIGDASIARLYGLYWAHVYKVVGAIAAVLGISWLYARQMQGPNWYEAALTVSGLWITLSIGFRFLVGHYVFRNSWRKLWSDYQFWRGRLWVFVLVAEAIAPAMMGWWMNQR